GTAIRISQSSVNQPFVEEINELIEEMEITNSHYTRERQYDYKHKGLKTYTDNSFYFSTTNKLNDKIRKDLVNKKLTLDLVLKMTIEEKEAFLGTAHKGDGSKNRETIYQNDMEQLELLQLMFHTIGKSAYMNENKMCVNWRNKTTTQLQNAKLGKIEQYDGLVWCISVENKAFMARRNGQIFLTGNSGFPKSHNIGLSIDKYNGIIGNRATAFVTAGQSGQRDLNNPDRTIRNYEANNENNGWGTALKPAQELICVARKPLSENTVAENVLKWGTGGINIDGCRIGLTNELDKKQANKETKKSNTENDSMFGIGRATGDFKELNTEGRFPANIIFECTCDEVIKGENKGISYTTSGNTKSQFNDNSGNLYKDYNDTGDIHTDPNCPCYILDKQTGILKSGEVKATHKRGRTLGRYQGSAYGEYNNQEENLNPDNYYGDSGGASRFFYVAKVSKKERNLGLEDFEEKIIEGRDANQDALQNPFKNRPTPKANIHPTVKPINLLTYLCRLVTPKNGIVLDPFMGSGSTGIAAQLEGFSFIGMEMEEEYFNIATARIEAYEKYRNLLK
ncbi:MAG: site-specific DNA-methyltransferase, partial [Caldilineaceae bacterium]